jgi:hypothetical protein
MLRITETLEDGKILRVRLDGNVTTVSLPKIEQICLRHQVGNEKKVVLLDMGGVVFMNDEVAKRLSAWRSDRLKIINGSPFIETLLAAVKKDNGE